MLDLSNLELRRRVFTSLFVMVCTSLSLWAQHPEPQKQPVIVQPGAPGQPSRVLPASTRGIMPPVSKKDIEFMQGMIMHHEQAVVMTGLIESRTENRDIRLLGERISKSQTDEINFMTRWLEMRGEPIESPEHVTHGSRSKMLMPGMLTPIQIGALMRAKGADFDRLFLTGMIQHHKGALVMVKDLFDAPGAGQDADLFNFASDVDSGQRAEIRSMETLLDKNP